jgi:hypothetical protein
MPEGHDFVPEPSGLLLLLLACEGCLRRKF